MKLHGIAAKLLDFKSTEPNGPVLISRPFDVRANTPQALQGLKSMQRKNLMEEYVFLDVPFVHQQHINLCGDASVNMLLAYHGKTTNDLAKNPRGILSGLTVSGIIAQIKEKGLQPTHVRLPTARRAECKASWQNGPLCKALDRHGPIICMGRLPGDVVDHCIVLIGASDETVVYHDPWSGPRCTKTLEQFNAFLDWSDPYTMIAGSGRRLIGQSSLSSAQS
ncbi:hypothetical protein GXB81_17295 [Paraburkholderia sp. Ac-20336]|uniref:papain-like cysteine protease family protein n=1 Tax=Paraburkholderia sp. Ac-20336 TaxID=2703886 RepID=UPI00198181C5|nr:papain-like cysteine protease family protein [Paraburkholderia sp. Ac-20336]MBN3804791.1 hypothetical protein [Paraburkholderia sp. Ac-20336]